ncbi:hypothetical protein [Pyruvatibacter mobilis]|uniref:hypothetical protein n=1 Tax=Pyruvatibacter mobilis TaxID=1712261 RepID=UPI003D15048D
MAVALIGEDTGKWTPEIAQALDHDAFKPAEADAMPADWYRRELEAGDLRATLWRFEETGNLLAVILWRVEESHGVREFVFVAARSLLPWANMRKPVLSGMEDYARKLGCHVARVHTDREKWADWLQGYGYGAREFVMRRVL